MHRTNTLKFLIIFSAKKKLFYILKDRKIYLIIIGKQRVQIIKEETEFPVDNHKGDI